MNFNKSEEKLARRILKAVLSRMEGRTKEGLWDGGEFPAYYKETILPQRSVMIDLAPPEMARLERMVAPDRKNPLTPREEGILKELKGLLAYMDKETIEPDSVLWPWLERFAEIVNKLEGAK